MTDTPHVFLAAYHDGLSPRYEVVPEGAMGAEEFVPKGAGVRVKELEWGPWAHGNAIAECIFGVYCIWDGHWRPPGQQGGLPSADPKSAAQADYEARIRAALELTTEPEPTSAEDAMTEIARLGQEWDAAPSPDPLAENMGLDAAKWAHEFRKIALRLGYSDMDEGWLIGWFANAIEYARRDKLPPDEGITTRLAALRETFCYASPGSDAEFTSLLLGFDTAAKVAVEAETSGYERGQDAAAIKMLAWLAKAVGGEDYVPCDGTETWDGDVHGTIYAILKAGKVYDDEDGRVAKLSHDWGTPTSGAYDLICCTAEDVATGRGFTGDAAADLAMAQESLRACLKLLAWRG